MDSKLIIQCIEVKTGLSVEQFAKQNNVSRQSVYDSIKGGCSRNIRVKIALIAQTLPSLIWSDNPEETRILDDMRYVRATK